MIRKRTCQTGWLILPVLLLIVTHPTTAQFKIPNDANVINVKRDFGAQGDGKQDDTNAIRRAIEEAMSQGDRYGKPKFVYFPTGTYLVSSTLKSRIDPKKWGAGWRAGLILVGQDRRNTTLKLKDNAPGFDNPSKPKPVIMTGSESEGSHENGRGNKAFRHSIISLTIDVGRGNRGAIGIDYLANNRGAIENVDIIGSESGYCGVSMTRPWPGPCLLKKVQIYGFDYGIILGQFQYGITMEHIYLENQRKLGIQNKQNVLAIRKLRSRNQVPVIVSRDDVSRIVLIDSELKASGFIADTAVNSLGRLLVRNTKIEGYQTAIAGAKYGGIIKGNERIYNKIKEYISHEPLSRYGKETHTINLPIEETPNFYTQYHSRWANVNKYRKETDPDDTEAIQRAIDAGKDIVYFPNGGYHVSRPIIVRGKVKKLVGFQSAIYKTDDFRGDELIRFDGGSVDFTVLEHLRIRGKILHNSTRTLVLRHLDHQGYANTPQGRGKLFVENVVGRPYRINFGQKVWARQLNAETKYNPLISVKNSTLWVLGYKTEGKETVLETVNGSTEVLGGLIYALSSTDRPAFVAKESQVSYFVVFNGNKFNKFYVRETRKGTSKTYREVHRLSPLFISTFPSSSSRSTEKSTKSSSLSPVPEESRIKLFPNPAGSQVRVVLPADKPAARVEIRDILGKTVFSDTFAASQTLNVSQLRRGVYVVRVRQGGLLRTQQLVIER